MAQPEVERGKLVRVDERDHVAPEAGDRRPGRGDGAGADGVLRRRALHDHGRAGRGQDAADRVAGQDHGPVVQAHPVHARPDALGHHRHGDPGGGHHARAGAS